MTGFHAALIIDRLERFGAILPAAAAWIEPARASWKPPSGAWSVLEIVNHLVDEEIDDFRTRVRSTLEDPSRRWPGIDPEGWARDRRYNERELGESVQRFVNARRESIAWLRSLRSPDWSRTYTHPKLGPFAAGAILASWAAHDALHLRQIAKRAHELAALDAGPYPVDYAGPWRA